MKQKLNFNDALELLLRGEKIYSEVSKCTFLLDDDTIFITDNNGSLSVLDRDNEMFTLDEVVGLWTCNWQLPMPKGRGFNRSLVLINPYSVWTCQESYTQFFVIEVLLTFRKYVTRTIHISIND